MIANLKEGLLKERIKNEIKRRRIEHIVEEIPGLRHLYPERITYRDTFLDRLRFYVIELYYSRYKRK